MTGKSRHSKRKLPRSKRMKGRQGITPVSTRQQVIPQTDRPAPHTQVAVPSASVTATMATPAVGRYGYVAAELKRIGILTGAILVLLVILALVFS